jgi:hypothetical protein
MRIQQLLVGVVLALAAARCGPPPLAHTQPSAELLAEEVLTAVARRDEARLRALSVDEREFELRVWPGLPAAQPERNMPWSYVWLDLRQKSDAMLQRTLGEHGGRHYDLEAVHFLGESTNHGTYRVHRGTLLRVRDAAGTERELRLLGSMIETDAGWKVFSYLADR